VKLIFVFPHAARRRALKLHVSLRRMAEMKRLNAALHIARTIRLPLDDIIADDQAALLPAS
jgi:hypothetical protein